MESILVSNAPYIPRRPYLGSMACRPSRARRSLAEELPGGRMSYATSISAIVTIVCWMDWAGLCVFFLTRLNIGSMISPRSGLEYRLEDSIWNFFSWRPPYKSATSAFSCGYNHSSRSQMSFPPFTPNYVPTHDTGDLGHPRSQGDDSQHNFATISAGWGIRCIFRDFYFYLHFGIPFSYQSRIQRVMDTAHLSYSDLKLLMALNARNREQRGRVFGDIKEWLGFLETLEDWDGLTGNFPRRSMKLKLNPNSDEVTPLPSQIPLPGTRTFRTTSGGGGRPVLTEPLERFHNEWKVFLKNISNEWTTLNIISALMVTYVNKLAWIAFYRI